MPFAKFKLQTHDDSTQMPFAKFKLQTHDDSTQMPFAKFKLQTHHSTQMSFAKFKLQDEERQKMNETSAIGTYNKPLTNLQYTFGTSIAFAVCRPKCEHISLFFTFSELKISKFFSNVNTLMAQLIFPYKPNFLQFV
jgi:hypothetical protein